MKFKLKLNYKIIGIICLFVILIGLYVWTTFKNEHVYETYTNQSHIPKIIHMTCKNKDNMNIIETMILTKLKDYKECSNRDRFILPLEKDISFFTNIITA